MLSKELRESFLELLGDVRERLELARELGVGGLETDFAAEISEAGEKSATPQHKPPAPSLAAFTPPKPATTVKPAVAAQPILTARQSIREKLEATKLSKISPSIAAAPPAAKPRPQNEPPAIQNSTSQRGESEMTGLFGDLTPGSEPLPQSNETIEEIRADIGECVRCPLYQGRTKIVHSDGNRTARIMFVGEAPGADEDAQGKPFIGRAGQLLTKIIESIGLKREEVFIGNVNRCRPPQNRTPTIQEARTCRQFLMREIAVVRPEIIVVLGNTATQNLLDTKEGITKLRGRFQDYYGVKVMPTFHPAYLLRDPSKKRETWEDMKIVRDELAKTAN